LLKTEIKFPAKIYFILFQHQINAEHLHLPCATLLRQQCVWYLNGMIWQI